MCSRDDTRPLPVGKTPGTVQLAELSSSSSSSESSSWASSKLLRNVELGRLSSCLAAGLSVSRPPGAPAASSRCCCGCNCCCGACGCRRCCDCAASGGFVEGGSP